VYDTVYPSPGVCKGFVILIFWWLPPEVDAAIMARFNILALGPLDWMGWFIFFGTGSVGLDGMVHFFREIGLHFWKARKLIDLPVLALEASKAWISVKKPPQKTFGVQLVGEFEIRNR
jgi:hypothetical protein